MGLTRPKNSFGLKLLNTQKKTSMVGVRLHDRVHRILIYIDAVAVLLPTLSLRLRMYQHSCCIPLLAFPRRIRSLFDPQCCSYPPLIFKALISMVSRNRLSCSRNLFEGLTGPIKINGALIIIQLCCLESHNRLLAYTHEVPILLQMLV